MHVSPDIGLPFKMKVQIAVMKSPPRLQSRDAINGTSPTQPKLPVKPPNATTLRTKRVALAWITLGCSNSQRHNAVDCAVCLGYPGKPPRTTESPPISPKTTFPRDAFIHLSACRNRSLAVFQGRCPQSAIGSLGRADSRRNFVVHRTYAIQNISFNFAMSELDRRHWNHRFGRIIQARCAYSSDEIN